MGGWGGGPLCTPPFYHRVGLQRTFIFLYGMCPDAAGAVARAAWKRVFDLPASSGDGVTAGAVKMYPEAASARLQRRDVLLPVEVC